jgi:hypothetical protein
MVVEFKDNYPNIENLGADFVQDTNTMINYKISSLI